MRDRLMNSTLYLAYFYDIIGYEEFRNLLSTAIISVRPVDQLVAVRSSREGAPQSSDSGEAK